ncbi:probable G-protein coupled receptor 45 [Dasypus novemcinctus]|uniref:probable G-protein coupled receptor 45 n=1 Tax=Dasypus novemcinctus TaxID=9361 RepID=UPI00265DD08B|nr:probable G-protein coupled receptor 45 [Dasypus novemcinctus]XP_058134257.1 probable G-protein coupled receptor 45 [Dasypus novemcinctus]XP_058134258.1 probable G-protein coupled receptor 45 [Dasypus novemcinctus]XP_058134259.1 probable G-protein coupled receptor 45 [Dasypus novemcinctus]XP_058134261.1 probable G-protein coupled receptor 45 [Dasypus novemcinctus]
MNPQCQPVLPENEASPNLSSARHQGGRCIQQTEHGRHRSAEGRRATAGSPGPGSLSAMACNGTSMETRDYPLLNTSHAPDPRATPLPAPFRVSLAIIMMLMIAVGFLGNTVVCVIVYQRPAMRSAINLLLATLAFSDIMLSLCCMPFTAVTLLTVHWRFGDSFCRLSATLYWFFVLEGVAILLIISVDRFLIIVQRQDKLTPRRAKAIIALSWALSFCLAVPSLGGWTLVEVPTRAPQCVLGYTELPAGRAYAATLVVAVFFAPFGVMLCSYLCILNTVRKNAVRVHSQPDGLDLRRLTGPVRRRRGRQHPVSVDLSFKTKAFTTILILFVGFSLCWLPHSVYSLLSVFSRRFYCSASFRPAGTCVLWLTYLKSVFNPIVYCWRIKKFREACLELLPHTCQVLPGVPERLRRRIRPSTVYVCNENQSAV